jgi:hypothetical protein
MTLPITEHVEQDTEPSDSLQGPMSSPKILNMRAYTINGKPLYYGHPDSNEAYCLPEKQWTSKPSYMDYFDEREIQPSDLGNVVLHGLMDDNDYNSLDQAGLIDPILKQIYEKMRELTGKIQELQQASSLGKSDDEDEESEEESEEEPSEETGESDEPVSEEPAESEPSEPTSVNPAFDNLLSAIKDGVSSSVLDQIIQGVSDLDIHEKLILKLVSEKFGRSESPME